jgi:hypothetical protein
MRTRLWQSDSQYYGIEIDAIENFIAQTEQKSLVGHVNKKMAEELKQLRPAAELFRAGAVFHRRKGVVDRDAA